jgi:hypothetical protein
MRLMLMFCMLLWGFLLMPITFMIAVNATFLFQKIMLMLTVAMFLLEGRMPYLLVFSLSNAHAAKVYHEAHR